MLLTCVCWQYVFSEKYTAACDMWSVGCVMMEMATKEPPWTEWAENWAALYVKVPLHC